METGGIYLGSAREREEQFRVNRVESKAVQPVGTLPKKSANETMEGGETETIKTGEREGYIGMSGSGNKIQRCLKKKHNRLWRLSH